MIVIASQMAEQRTIDQTIRYLNSTMTKCDEIGRALESVRQRGVGVVAAGDMKEMIGPLCEDARGLQRRLGNKKRAIEAAFAANPGDPEKAIEEYHKRHGRGRTNRQHK